MASRRSRAVRFFKAIVFALLPLLALVAVVEVGFRLLAPEVDRTHRRAMVEPDPDLIWRLIPRKEGRFATNELGFRDRPLDPSARHRVLLLGDSVSWGHGSDLDAIYPVQLEDLLNQSEQTARFDVINTAVPGYSTFQQLRLLELHGFALEPDLVLLQVCLNDVVERYYRLAAFGGPDVFLGIDTRQAIPGLLGGAIRNSRAFAALARFIARRNHRAGQYRVEELMSDSLSPTLESAWSTMLDELEQMRALVEARGTPFLVVVAPYAFQLENRDNANDRRNDPRGRRQAQDRLLLYARDHSVAMVDLLPAFLHAREASDEALFVDANHFSDRGHRVAARALLQPIQSQMRRGD